MSEEDPQNFDDWYNDCEAAEENLENQAAKFNTRTAEERTKVEGDALNAATVVFAGNLILKFQDGDGATKMTNSSAHLVKKLDDTTFVALTAASNLMKAGCEFQEGMFFMGRSGASECNALFKIAEHTDEAPAYKHRDADIDLSGPIHLGGTNLSAIRMTLVKGECPEVPELESLKIEEESLPFGDYTASGYADVTITDGNKTPCNNTLFSMAGAIEAVAEGDDDTVQVAGFNMDTSSGQYGGGLVDSVTGKCVGIFTGVSEMGDEEYSIATILGQSTIEFVNEAFA